MIELNIAELALNNNHSLAIFQHHQRIQFSFHTSFEIAESGIITYIPQTQIYMTASFPGAVQRWRH
jgi:hypothetical protein